MVTWSGSDVETKLLSWAFLQVPVLPSKLHGQSLIMGILIPEDPSKVGKSEPITAQEGFSVLQFGFVLMWRERALQSIPGRGRREQPGDGHAALSCPGQDTSTNSARLSLSALVSFLQSKEFMLE